MAQQLQPLNIAAPAFKGLNTQDSPLSGDPQYASVADNVVIDSYGRIGSRRGVNVLTIDMTALGTDKIHALHEYEDSVGNLKYFSVGNSKILEGVTTLTDVTPAAYTITEQHFQIVNFNDHCYFFNKQHEPLVYSTALGAVTKMTAVAGYDGTAPQGGTVLSAYGRLWVGDVHNEPNMVYWSDLLAGHKWGSGTSGSLNLDKVWPDGSDKVVALAAWNNYLVIFGYNSIVIYQGAESPATMSLVDTISGVGCVSKGTVQFTGSDLLFLSARGVLSLGRTIQEKSAPLRDISKAIRDDLIALWKLQDESIYSCYSARFGFYLLSLPTNNVVYCFDVRAAMEDGSYRVTRWVSQHHYCFKTLQNDDLLIGNSAGICRYEGYLDLGEPYTIRYFSNPMSFGNPTTLKFLKKITPTIIGGATATFSIKWSYDFTNKFFSETFVVADSATSFYNVSEYNDAQYTSGVQTTAPRINCSGSGNLVTIGLEAPINGAPVSLQEFNILATTGRIY